MRRFYRTLTALTMALVLLRCFGLRALKKFRSSNAYKSSQLLLMSSNKQKEKKPESIYSKTVILPQTSFDQRANAVTKEPALQKWWIDNNIYEELSQSNSGDPFILHDGPPYANGNLHIGHALNKILKDFINRYQLLRGRRARYVPGWDCHGLPIELKVLQSMKSEDRKNLDTLRLRENAAQFALNTIEGQKASFQRYGVWGDWENPYMTLQPEYEAAQIKVFGEMVSKGHIYRGKKPVHWSPSSRTALAEAELEYPDDHVSRSIYVGFKATKLSPLLEAQYDINTIDMRIAVWTTTPWTIPANLAIAINEDIDYCVASHPQILNGAKLIVARNLVESLSKTFGLEEVPMEVESTYKGCDLLGISYQHPLFDRISEIVVGGDYITTDAGTGLVHTAPGHGQEDYITGLKYELPLLSPVDDAGRFTDEAGQEFCGLDVLGDGNQAVIEALEKRNVLIKEENYNHKYPYDWRTKKPTIFRATEQWFASVSNFRNQALQAIDEVQWTPSVGRNRIYAMVESRGDWCISRQRSWGVPIPVFYHKLTGEPLLSEETISYVESIFRSYGSDVWWKWSEMELLPESLRHLSGNYTKGTDTMDVWFDSGTSWAGVLGTRDSMAYPADIYLEGSDQHRGWFQSSLLTSVATTGRAPYKAVLTHGFVLDEKGYKMSKSLGNVLDPDLVINGGPDQKKNPAYGADTLRFWVSSVDYSGDVCVGTNIMKQTSESVRKIRNTFRYLLGSLSDYDPKLHSFPLEKLASLDQYILGRLSEVVVQVEAAYETYQFYKANQILLSFINSDLSSFYIDMAKDRLYITAKNDFRRRSCQMVICIILQQLATMLSPLLPHLAEEVWTNMPFKVSSKSIFQNGWISDQSRYPSLDDSLWSKVRLIRNDVNKCMEVARQDKEIGASMEAKVVLFVPDIELRDKIRSMISNSTTLGDYADTDGIDDLRYVFMSSQVLLVDDANQLFIICPKYKIATDATEAGVMVGISGADGKKCERCWYYCPSVDSNQSPLSGICSRCADVIKVDQHDISFTQMIK